MNYYSTGTSSPGHYGTPNQYQEVHASAYQHHMQRAVPIPYASSQSVGSRTILRLFTLFNFWFSRHATFIPSPRLTRSGLRDTTILVRTFTDLLHGLGTTSVIRPLKCLWYVPTS